jgi:GNAT superfamily N-acetyltransferase
VELRFAARPYDDPIVTAAVIDLQREYLRRYGSEDETAVDGSEFAPPDGLFLVATTGDVLGAMGGWRRHDDGVVEIKRMYVPEGMRRRGLARALLSELERRAIEAGVRRVVLNTGTEQPEAIALYESCGYLPAPGFGIYENAPLARFYGKNLSDVSRVASVSG